MSVASAAVAAYIVAGLLFILSLAGLSRHESAKIGNSFGIAGMFLALAATVALVIDDGLPGGSAVLVAVAVAAGAAIGLWRARSVPMTGMPELIAMLHSFVGLAAVLVGWNGYLSVEGVARSDGGPVLGGAELGIHSAEVVIGVFIGAVTFTGSITNTTVRTAKTTSAPRFSQFRPGSMSGLLLILADNFRKATIEPVKVTAPMKTPMTTSAEWMPSRSPVTSVCSPLASTDR